LKTRLTNVTGGSRAPLSGLGHRYMLVANELHQWVEEASTL